MGYENLQFISVHKTIPDECGSFATFDRAIGKMDVLRFTTTKPFLGSLVISSFEGWNWGEENWFAGSIYMFLKGQDAAWKKSNEYVFAHEMGHLFLQAYIGEKDPIFSKLTDLQKQSFVYAKYLFPIFELRDSDPICAIAGSACDLKIQAMADASPVNLRGISGEQLVNNFIAANKAHIDLYLGTIMSYHELFADILEAVYFDNPDVNSLAWGGYDLPNQPCRSFTSQLPSDFSSADPHCSLSPIRRELWLKVIAPSLGNKPELLKRIAEAIWAEAQQQIVAPAAKLQSDEAGKRLLKRLLDQQMP